MCRSIEEENNPYYNHYRDTMCLKPFKCRCHSPKKQTDKLKSVAEFSDDDINDSYPDQLCVLSKGHAGRCSDKLPIFNKSEAAKKTMKKIDLSIYTTPGNDDYIYINRRKRTFPIQLTSAEEKLIRNKQGTKLKCAIPLKDASTPFLLATAYFDYIIFVINIHDVASVIDPVKLAPFKKYIAHHKNFLTQHYASFDRILFTPTEGHTICPITKLTVSMNDFADPERDTRYDPRDNDIQMGHIESRSELCASVRGGNIAFMTRRGNAIIGERNFLEDTYKTEMQEIDGSAEIIAKKDDIIDEKDDIIAKLKAKVAEMEAHQLQVGV
tara:strand:- start:28420 stop:29394 length:975 start_codon:yes stop_codon:yes gene_type:complete